MPTQFGSIPTIYSDVHFRSRLEAKWAAFFDSCGWRWEYEPFDLKGYIPDFIIIDGFNFIVEVKPAATLDDLQACEQKIEKSGYQGNVLTVGSVFFDIDVWVDGQEYWVLSPGNWGTILPNDIDWWSACFGWCNNCKKLTIDTWGECAFCKSQSWSSEYDAKQIAKKLWRQASNEVQWKGRSA